MIIRGLIYSLILIGIALVVGFIWHFVKAFKDPDVRRATDLRMTITRYHLYQNLYDEFQEVLSRHDWDSDYAHDYFRQKIYPKIPNMNEWRRFQDAMLKETQARMFDRINNLVED